MLKPATIVSSLVAFMAAVVVPAHAQGPPTQRSHAFLAHDIADKVAGVALRVLLSKFDDDLAIQARRKSPHSLQRDTVRALQREMIGVPLETSTSASGVEVVDFEAELLAELANLDAYVVGPEFDEDAAAPYQEGGTLDYVCSKMFGRLAFWLSPRKLK